MRARVARATLDVGVGDLGELRLRELHRVVHEVTGDQRVLAVRLDPHRRVPGRVAGSGLEPHAVPEIGVGLDDVGETGVDDRRDRVAVHVFAGQARRAHELELGLGVEVAGRGERRHPRVAVAVRVPPDVIGVQVGVHDELDVARA